MGKRCSRHSRHGHRLTAKGLKMATAIAAHLAKLDPKARAEYVTNMRRSGDAFSAKVLELLDPE